MSTQAAAGGAVDAPILASLEKSVKDLGEQVNTKLESFATKKDAEILDTSIKGVKESLGKIEMSIRENDMDKKYDGLQFNGAFDFFHTLVKAQRGDSDSKDRMFGDNGYVKRMDVIMREKYKAPSGFHTASNEGEIFIHPEWSNEIQRTMSQRSGIANLVRKISMSGNLYRIPALVDKNHSTSVAGGITVSYTQEGGTSTASTASWEFVEFRPNKVTGLFYVTEEMLEDASAFASLVPPLFMEALDSNREEKVLLGTGVGEPLGMLHTNNPSLISTTRNSSGNSIEIQDLLNLRSRIYGDYNQCYWLTTQDMIPQLGVLTLGDLPIYLSSAKNGEGFDTILGRPVLYSDHLAAVASANDLALVNPTQYVLATKGGVTQQQSIHVRFLYGETAIRFVERHDGQPLWRAALTPKNSALSTRSPFVRVAA
jgi:HK97 family phage major capsid protein